VTIARDIQHVVNVSGGKDSTATYLLALESGRDFRAVFADTGNEHELTYEYVARLHERTGGPKVEWVRADFAERLAKHRAHILANWPAELMAGREGAWQWKPKRGTDAPRPALEPAAPKNIYRSATVRAVGGAWRWLLARRPMGEAEAIARTETAAALNEPTGNPYLDMCIWKGFFPGRMRQFCTDELKVEPIINQIVFPMLKSGPVLQWLGIRAEESGPRSKQPRFNRHDSGCHLWRPIFRWTVEQVWKQHSKHGLHPNPLYAIGRGRVGCDPCVNESKPGIRLIADHSPASIDRIRRWEKIVAQASKYGESSFFPAMTDPSDRDRVGIGRYSNIDDIVEWSRTARGGRQFDIFFAQQSGGGCSHNLHLCERAA
jgi:3'-phosphoadenosine 5'-phosphosulfate sulfotransferase (PAPS reductase)/FAD synthetase